MSENRNAKRRVILWLLLAAFFAWLIFDVFTGNLAERTAYRMAEKLIRAGDFEQADKEVGRFYWLNSDDRGFLQAYCRAYPLYLRGQVQEAAEQYRWDHARYILGYQKLRNMSWLDWHAVVELESERNRLEKKKKEREEAERKARKERQEKEYQEKVVSSEMPFLGMREEDVERTKLGRYTGKVRTGQEFYWYTDKTHVYRDPRQVGKREVRHYDFVRNGELVLEVFCTDGTVDELARYENGMIYYTWAYTLPDELTGGEKYRKTWNPKGYVANTKKSAGKSSYSSTKDKEDYVSEEDLYEDYADEFEDIDDAADYYAEHYQ